MASTRDEYVTLVEQLKETVPSAPKAGERRTKAESNHIALVQALEDRLPAIDAEIAVSLPCHTQLPCHGHMWLIFIL